LDTELRASLRLLVFVARRAGDDQELEPLIDEAVAAIQAACDDPSVDDDTDLEGLAAHVRAVP
jgi:hypothetical protein